MAELSTFIRRTKCFTGRDSASVNRDPVLVDDNYQRSRTHLALDKDPPLSRCVAVPADGDIVAIPHLGSLHRCYERPLPGAR